MSWSILLLASLFSTQRDTSPLPLESGATLEVVQTERWGMWEKSLIVTLPEPTRVLSTNEGFVTAKAVINHGAHPALWMRAFEELAQGKESGGDVYMAQVEERLAKGQGLHVDQVAFTATAVDMDNLAVVTQRSAPFVVTVLATAGAKTNAHRAGTDEGKNIESAGTVNIVVMVNAQFSDAAQLNAVILATEAKTAAFQDLKVPSSYTPSAQATGTGTDTVIVVPSNTGATVTYAGAHAKVGELIAKATHQAVTQALILQNGAAP